MNVRLTRVRPFSSTVSRIVITTLMETMALVRQEDAGARERNAAREQTYIISA